MKRKLLVFALVIAMCASILAGCQTDAPKTASELLARAEKAMSAVSNFSAELTMDMGINMDADLMGVNMLVDVPVKMVAEMDFTKNNSHTEMTLAGDIKAVMEMDGQKTTTENSLNEKAELYRVNDGNKTITYSNYGYGWEMLEEPNTEVETDNLKELVGLFDKAELKKDGNSFIVTMKFADVLAAESVQAMMEDLLKSGEDSFGAAGFAALPDMNGIIDAWGDATLFYVFDANYCMRAVYTNEIKIDLADMLKDVNTEDVLGGATVDEMSVTFKLAMEFDDFGEVDADDVAVPKQVIEQATENAQTGVDGDNFV